MKEDSIWIQLLVGVCVIVVIFFVGFLVLTQVSAEVKICDEKYGVNNWTIEDAGKTVNVMNPFKETPKKGLRCIFNGTREEN